MPHSKPWARRLVRELSKDPQDLLCSSSYRDPIFLRLLFDQIDEKIFYNPRTGLAWARVLPELAVVVPQQSGVGGLREHRGDLAKAHAILGGAYRANSQHDQGVREYETALRIGRSESISSLILASIMQRYSYLKACQGLLEEALEMAVQAVEVFRKHGSSELPEALGRVGYILAEMGRFNESLGVLSEALQLANPKLSPIAARIHHTLVHNIAYVVSEAPRNASDLNWALGQVRQAYRNLKGQRKSVPRHKLQWLEGLIWVKMGLHGKGERCLDAALKGFKNLGLPYETALVSLDRGTIHHFFGEWFALEKLAMDTFRRFRSLASNTQALAALSQWTDAVKGRCLTDAVTIETRRVIELRLGPGGDSKIREGKSPT